MSKVSILASVKSSLNVNKLQAVERKLPDLKKYQFCTILLFLCIEIVEKTALRKHQGKKLQWSRFRKNL